MAMSSERRCKVKEIFDAARQASFAERMPLIKDRCGDDESLYREVKSLLDRFEQAQSTLFPESPPVNGGAQRANAELVSTSDSKPETKNTATQPLPARFGKYRVMLELGRGKFGTVYLGHDDGLNRDVAIKVHDRSQFRSDDQVQEFLNEARTIAALKHPGVVTAYDQGETDDGDCYVVMEYVDGGHLAEWRAKEEPSPARVAELVAQVAEAIHQVHLARFVHRDLKPANILLDRKGQPHVGDFGLAVHERVQWELAGQMAGTVCYMAPEQIRGEVQFIDGRTDIWAIGVVLYELLWGRRPFQGEIPTLLDEIVHRQPKPPRMIDDQIPAEPHLYANRASVWC